MDVTRRIHMKMTRYSPIALLILTGLLLAAWAFARDDSGNVFSTANLPVTQQSDIVERLIIRTGNIDIVVEDTEAAVDDIGRLADGLGVPLESFWGDDVRG